VVFAVAPICPAQDTGLIGHWSFDDPANLGKDSVSTNNGVVVGGAYSFATSRIGAGALALGGGGHLEIADSPALRFTIADSYTLGAWVYLTALPGAWSGVVTKSRDVAPWWGFWIDSANEWVAGGGQNLVGPLVAIDANGLPVAQWQHIVVVQDGAAAVRNLYVDGTLVISGPAYDANGNGPMWIGGAVSVSEPFSGLVDDVRLYNRALTDPEIAQLFGAPTPSAPLPLALLQQPADASVFPGDQAVFTARANALNLTYQWYKSNTPAGASGAADLGTATLTTGPLTAADNGASYYVVYTGQSGSVTSRVARVTVNSAVGVDAGLVGHWTFDDPANLGKDSASSNNAVAVGGAYSFASARVGAGALALNGSDGHLEVPDNAGLRFTAGQSYTVTAWLYTATLSGGWEGLVTKSRDAAPWYGLWIDNLGEWIGGSVRNLVGPPVATDANGAIIPQWHHAAMVQDGVAGTQSLYVDGTFATSGNAFDANGGGPLWIGGAASVSEFFNGLVDDVRLYNRAVTDQEIAQLFSAPAPSGSLPLALTVQPRDLVTLPGEQVTFTAQANALNLNYQWYKGTAAIGAPASAPFTNGQTTATFTTDLLTLADDGSTYSVVFSGQAGSITSRVARLTVKAPVDNLLAHYTFDDPANLGADATGYNPGLPIGGASFSADSRVGSGALRVDGNNGHLAVPDVHVLRFALDQNYTVCAWVKTDGLPGGWHGLVTKSRDVAPWYGLWISDGGLWVAGGDNLNGTAATSGWHHVAVVQDAVNSARTLYVDGASVATGNPVAGDGTGPLWIGGASGVSEYFKGWLDDVRIYRRTLTEAEINALATVSTSLGPVIISRGANGVTVTYTGTLQTASSILGPWTDVSQATSPLTITPSASQAYYRARQ
jgi:uncharacterized protein YciI